VTLSETQSAFRERRLNIDCVEMALIQNREAETITFKGPGYIRQGEDDRLCFKIYAMETVNTDPFRDLNTTMRETAGTVYRETDYYTLTAMAVDGTKWTASRILPQLRWPTGSRNPIVTGVLAVMEADWTSVEGGSSLLVHYFSDTRIPCVEDRCRFTAAGCKFTVEKQDAAFVVEAHGPGSLADRFHMRIQEALRFLLAQSVDWRMLLRHEGSRRRLVLASGTPRPRSGPAG